MKRWLGRLVTGIFFAVPLMLLTYVVASAGEPVAQPLMPDTSCQDCHPAFHQAWMNGAHGKATTDPLFQVAWKERGEDPKCLVCHVTGYNPLDGTYIADGITCEACHSPIAQNHPEEPMPTDQSGKLCGACHSETYFEWQVSVHREKGLGCSGCHDPHQTGLKMENSLELCASCHRARASNFTHSAHSQSGLICSDCHMTQLSSMGEEGHARRDHSFFVSLSSCNTCHSYQMHDPVQVHPEQPTPLPPDELVSSERMNISTEPVPVSPMGYTMLSGLVGVAVGIIVAPYIERMQKRSKDEE